MEKDLWGKLQSFLYGKAKTLPTEPRSERPVAPKMAAPGALSADGFEVGLTQVIAEKASAVSGKVHIVNIQTIRERLGDRWEQATDRIHRIIESTLQNRLSRKDFYTRKDLNYVIIFGELSEDEAALKCSLLADEIMAKVLGSDTAFEALDIRAAAVRIDGTVDFKGVHGIDAISRLLDKAEQSRSSAGATESDRPAAAKRTQSQLDALTNIVRTADKEIRAIQVSRSDGETILMPDRLEALLRLLREAELGLEHLTATLPDQDEGRGPMLQIPWRGALTSITEVIQLLLQEAENKLAGENTSEIGHSAEARSEEIPSDVTFLYHPIWKVRQKVMGIYLCEMAVDYGSQRLVGEAVLPSDPDASLVAVSDRLILRRALIDIRKSLDAGTISVTCVPVHYLTLANANTRRDYISLCRAIPPECRSMLIWEVIRIPPGIWESPLVSTISAIKPFARAVFLRIGMDHRNRNLGALAALDVHSVGVDLRDHHEPEFRTVRVLDGFPEVAHRLGLRTHAHGIDSRSLAIAAIGAGFDYISGSAISEVTEAPWGIVPMETEELYRSKLTEL